MNTVIYRDKTSGKTFSFDWSGEGDPPEEAIDFAAEKAGLRSPQPVTTSGLLKAAGRGAYSAAIAPIAEPAIEAARALPELAKNPFSSQFTIMKNVGTAIPKAAWSALYGIAKPMYTEPKRYQAEAEETLRGGDKVGTLKALLKAGVSATPGGAEAIEAGQDLLSGDPERTFERAGNLWGQMAGLAGGERTVDARGGIGRKPPEPRLPLVEAQDILARDIAARGAGPAPAESGALKISLARNALNASENVASNLYNKPLTTLTKIQDLVRRNIAAKGEWQRPLVHGEAQIEMATKAKKAGKALASEVFRPIDESGVKIPVAAIIENPEIQAALKVTSSTHIPDNVHHAVKALQSVPIDSPKSLKQDILHQYDLTFLETQQLQRALAKTPAAAAQVKSIIDAEVAKLSPELLTQLKVARAAYKAHVSDLFSRSGGMGQMLLTERVAENPEALVGMFVPKGGVPFKETQALKVRQMWNQLEQSGKPEAIEAARLSQLATRADIVKNYITAGKISEIAERIDAIPPKARAALFGGTQNLKQLRTWANTAENLEEVLDLVKKEREAKFEDPTITKSLDAVAEKLDPALLAQLKAARETYKTEVAEPFLRKGGVGKKMLSPEILENPETLVDMLVPSTGKPFPETQALKVKQIWDQLEKYGTPEQKALLEPAKAATRADLIKRLITNGSAAEIGEKIDAIPPKARAALFGGTRDLAQLRIAGDAAAKIDEVLKLNEVKGKRFHIPSGANLAAWAFGVPLKTRILVRTATFLTGNKIPKFLAQPEIERRLYSLMKAYDAEKGLLEPPLERPSTSAVEMPRKPRISLEINPEETNPYSSTPGLAQGALSPEELARQSRGEQYWRVNRNGSVTRSDSKPDVGTLGPHDGIVRTLPGREPEVSLEGASASPLDIIARFKRFQAQYPKK